MSEYFRPIAQIDSARPQDAYPLAGGACWFQHVERIERGGVHEIVPAREVPQSILGHLVSQKPNICELSLDRPRLMGVLNVTPDSFSDGGLHHETAQGIERAKKLVAEGCDIVDIGGESTRPGAQKVDQYQEFARVGPVIQGIRELGLECPISIDTRNSGTARKALKSGANFINDVSALQFDPDMAGLVARSDVPLCLMHMRGQPENMQDAPSYGDVLLDVFDDLNARLQEAEASGIARHNIIVDPGIGFGKTLEHNLILLRGLSLFHGLGCAVLLGVSRKRFIGTLTGVEDASLRGPGSVAVGLEGLRQGVQILRVHDMAMHGQAIALWRAMQGRMD
ncbi:MAG: dihydropteroate synthase [Pseudomonadota bacterium]